MRRRILLPLAAGVLVVAGAASAYRLARPAGVMHDLERAGGMREIAPRLSFETEHRPCTLDSLSTDSSVARERCGENEDAPLAFLNALAAAKESLDPDTLRAAALAAVIWPDGKEESLHRAVTLLEDARRLSPNSVPVLVDLSAVHLVRAERTQNARDLSAALDAAEEALRLDSRNSAALFNAALALQAQAIDEEAARAWDAYLAVDSASPWADEARGRRALLLAPAPAPPAPTLSATAAEVSAFADRDPQRARLMGMDSVLGEWGGAMLEGNAARADSLLRLAELLGAALERRSGEASLADAVRAVRATRHDGRATRTLARAHRAYAAGQVDFSSNPESPQVRDSFALVLQLRPPSPTLVAWARTFHAATLYYADKRDAAKAVLDSLLAETDSIRHPAVVARVRWMRGTPLMRGSGFAAAHEEFAKASATFERLGETEHFGTTRYLQGEAAYEEGDTLGAYVMLHQALTALRPHRSSVWLHGALKKLAEWATEDGMQGAAMRIQDEDVAVAMRSTDPGAAPEALLARARIRALAGHTSLAMEDLNSAKVRVDRLQDDHFTNLWSYSRAVVAPRANDARHAADLDSAVRYFAKGDNVFWYLPTLLRRADLRLAARDWAGADADLDTVTARIRTMSRRTTDFHLRSAIIEQARSRFDQRVMLHARNGPARDALQALERGRISFAHTGGGHAAPIRRPLVPPGQVAVAYTLINDTLLTWTIRDDSVTLLKGHVNRDTLLSTIRWANAALETRERAPLAEPHLRRLYDWLIRPVQRHLGPAETSLSILADGEIAGVPFPALRDTSRGRYLIEDHSLRFVTSLSDAAAPEPAPTAARRVLLVADPAFDPRSHRTLDRLKGAGAEVDALQAVYPDADVLRDSHATRDTIAARARGAGVIHFAGHAVFDDTQPERSFLVLADTGRLSADAVGALDLRGVRLVVLSACRTLPSRSGRSDGIAGLSGALLSAGAGGVIGSLWQADDRLTQPLMLKLHRQYAQEGKNPPEALRQAQLAMLRSTDSAQRSPASWAGFRYVER